MPDDRVELGAGASVRRHIARDPDHGVAVDQPIGLAIACDWPGPYVAHGFGIDVAIGQHLEGQVFGPEVGLRQFIFCRR